MPMTQADWAALAAAGAAGGTAYLTGLNAQQQAVNAGKTSMLQGVPGAPTAGFNPDLPALSSEFGVGQDAIDAVYKNYPTLAWMLSVPNLGGMIVKWAQAGTDPAVAQAEFISSLWYQQNSDSVRKYIQNVQTDPGQAQSDLAAQESAISATLAGLGLRPTPNQINSFAQQSLVFGWTDQQIKDHITQSIHAQADGTFSFTFAGATSTGQTGGTLTADLQTIKAEAAKYLVPISDSTAQSFASSMAGGTMDAQGVTAYLQAQAASLYPSIAGAIKSGITPADYVTPYKEVAAQLLGVVPNSIDMTQAKWNRALSAPAQGGVPQAMTLYDWQQMLMKDPQYNYMQSINAKDRASSIAQGLGEMFGKTPTGPAGTTAFGAAGAPRIAGVPIT